MRARETMEIVRKALGLPPGDYARDPRLKEIAFGDWEGLTYLDVLKRDRHVVEQREARQVAVPSARRRNL